MIRYEAQPGLGLALRKHTLAARGAIAHPTLRKPGGSLTAQTIAELAALDARQRTRLAGLGL
jgi:4-hydroxy-tetrahydrodipicolinate synthase